MPDKDGKLTKAESKKAKEWLLEHGATEACPFCRNAHWSLVHAIVLAPQFNDKGIFVKSGIPCVAALCTRCAFLRFHSAIMLGIIEPDETAEQKEAKSG